MFEVNINSIGSRAVFPNIFLREIERPDNIILIFPPFERFEIDFRVLLRGKDDGILIDKQVTTSITIGFYRPKLMDGRLIFRLILNNPLIQVNSTMI